MTRTTIAEACETATERTWFHLAGLALIVVNAIALGLETYDPLIASFGPVIRGIEYVCLAGFVVELLIRFGAHLRARPGSSRTRGTSSTCSSWSRHCCPAYGRT